MLLLVAGLGGGCRPATDPPTSSSGPDPSDQAAQTGDDDPTSAKAAKSHPPNRLAQESSPYLLLHAHNPVDWFPWGEEALEKAQREGKVIFLSIGYSSCHWCHVMERESFMDEEIAQYMNEHFVCIKVDREERPDIDTIYMTALQIYFQLVHSPQGGGSPSGLSGVAPGGQSGQYSEGLSAGGPLAGGETG